MEPGISSVLWNGLLLRQKIVTPFAIALPAQFRKSPIITIIISTILILLFQTIKIFFTKEHVLDNNFSLI